MKCFVKALLLAVLCLLLLYPAVAETAVGDLLLWGAYEQDNDLSNGPESIEWQVLAVEEGRALLISRYALDSLQYNEEWKTVVWADSSLRAWLNEDFLQAAFTEAQQEAILETLVSTPANTALKTRGEEDVTDRIFVLSIDEARQYLKSGAARKAQGTPWAVEQQVFVKKTGGNAGNCWWWLRGIGQNPDSAVYVKEDGNIYFRGIDVDCYSCGVRPVMWVTLDKLN